MKAWFNQPKAQPKLHPPIRGWVEDLPEPNAPVGQMFLPSKMRINAINDTYLEVPRSAPLSRFAWVSSVFGFIPLAALFAYVFIFTLLGE